MSSPYEVRCYACNVSFPPGTRRCIHCGAKTGAPPLIPDSADLETIGAELPSGILANEGVGRSRDGAMADGETEAAPRTPLRLVLGAIWVLLAMMIPLFRACSGGGG